MSVLRVPTPTLQNRVKEPGLRKGLRGSRIKKKGPRGDGFG